MGTYNKQGCKRRDLRVNAYTIAIMNRQLYIGPKKYGFRMFKQSTSLLFTKVYGFRCRVLPWLEVQENLRQQFLHCASPCSTFSENSAFINSLSLLVARNYFLGLLTGFLWGFQCVLGFMRKFSEFNSIEL